MRQEGEDGRPRQRHEEVAGGGDVLQALVGEEAAQTPGHQCYVVGGTRRRREEHQVECVPVYQERRYQHG